MHKKKYIDMSTYKYNWTINIFRYIILPLYCKVKNKYFKFSNMQV